MFVRTAKSGKNAYVQLAHNTWDPVRKRSTTKVLHSFGRAEELDAPDAPELDQEHASARSGGCVSLLSGPRPP